MLTIAEFISRAKPILAPKLTPIASLLLSIEIICNKQNHRHSLIALSFFWRNNISKYMLKKTTKNVTNALAKVMPVNALFTSVNIKKIEKVAIKQLRNKKQQIVIVLLGKN